MANSGTQIIRNATPDVAGEEVLQNYTGGAGDVHIASSDLRRTPPFDEQIYAGTVATGTEGGEQTTSGGLEVYTFWAFQVVGVDADDDITIQISLDGVTFVKPDIIEAALGTAIIQSAANIEVDGIYILGFVASQLERMPLGIKAIKVVRETAVTGGIVTVYARGH